MLSFGTGVIFSVFPVLLILLDSSRVIAMTMQKRPCRRAHTFISLLAAVLAGGVASAAASDGMQLYHLEAKPSYCKIGRHIWHVGSTFVLYYAYFLMALVHEAFVTFYQWDNRKFNTETQNAMQHHITEGTVMSALETARSNTTVDQDDFLYIYPKPFILDESGESVLYLQNIHVFEWIALRVLVSVPRSYYIYPQKVIIPPQRSATISVRLHGYFDLLREDVGLMLQWFPVGRQCPSMDVTRLWLRPHLKPRSQWKFYVLPIYHEPRESAAGDQ